MTKVVFRSAVAAVALLAVSVNAQAAAPSAATPDTDLGLISGVKGRFGPETFSTSVSTISGFWSALEADVTSSYSDVASTFQNAVAAPLVLSGVVVKGGGSTNPFSAYVVFDTLSSSVTFTKVSGAGFTSSPQVATQAVPGPIAGAGLWSLAVLGAGAVFFRRRRAQA